MIRFFSNIHGYIFDISYFANLDIIPKEQVVDIGRQARMECIVETEEGDDSGRHVITWMKDGQPLPNRTRIIISGRTLQIFVLQRDDYGKKGYCISM